MADMPYRQLIELSDDCVKYLDLDGRIVAVNQPGLSLLGSTAEQLAGNLWETLWPEPSKAAVARACAAAREGNTTRFVAYTGDTQAPRWWSALVGPLRNDLGAVAGIGAVSRDITQRLLLEEAMDSLNDSLRKRLGLADQMNVVLQEERDGADIARRAAERIATQSQKTAAIGQLVAGLAHDFNNNLQTIMSALDGLSSSADAMAPSQQRYLTYAEGAARHAAGNAKRLLAFSREHPYDPEYLELWSVVADVLPLIGATLGKAVTVRAEPFPTELHTFADRHAVQQALMNLAINARDACEAGGTLLLRLGEQTVSEEHDSPAQAEGHYVFIELVDDGAGMSDDVLDRMFEPFFTTKPEGKGTGLGMAQVLGVMRQASGTANITSKLGQGTTVRLLFPRTDAMVAV